MIAKRAILGNELIKEIISIRTDTLWKMLRQKKDGMMPGVTEEGATGKYDNKGAIFIPGGLILQDVDENPIEYESYRAIDTGSFREKIKSAMRYDNATLLFPDGIVSGINLDTGFFSKAARRIYTFKRAAFRRTMKTGPKIPTKISSDDIIRSHCPTFFKPPYGARTRISTCASIGLVDPPMFFAYCNNQLNFTQKQAEVFSRSLDAAQEPVMTKNGNVLYPPYIVVCHDTRYKENNFTGLTRILGIGKFGEFCTFSLEGVNPTLLGELKRKSQEFSPEDVFSEFDSIKVLGVLRVYAPTNAGKRSLKYDLHIVSPKKDLDISPKQIEKEARSRYHID
ncbi:MAG: hypothetical protein AB1Z20_15260 [Desulfobacterales bacterium]